jgi:hypothetical protein
MGGAGMGNILWSAAACRRFRFYGRPDGGSGACRSAEQSAVYPILTSRIRNRRQNTLFVHMGETECAGQ